MVTWEKNIHVPSTLLFILPYFIFSYCKITLFEVILFCTTFTIVIPMLCYITFQYCLFPVHLFMLILLFGFLCWEFSLPYYVNICKNYFYAYLVFIVILITNIEHTVHPYFCQIACEINKIYGHLDICYFFE